MYKVKKIENREKKHWVYVDIMIHNYVCCQGSKSIGEREQDRNNSTRKENTRKLFRTDVILQCFLKRKVQVSREKKNLKKEYILVHMY